MAAGPWGPHGGDTVAPNEAELISQARTGGEVAFTELYVRHRMAALRYARSLCGRDADAEDLVAESFALVLEQLRRGGGPRVSFRAYLFTTIRHRLYSADRREVLVGETALLDVAVFDRDSDSRSDAAMVARAFQGLSSAQQQVLVQLDIDGERPGRVANRLGLSSSALAMRASRARSALAEAYLVEHSQLPDDDCCRAVRPRLGRYVRGTLPDTDSRKVDAHLDCCERCRALVAELRDLNRVLRVAPIVVAGPCSGRGVRVAGRLARHTGRVARASKTITGVAPVSAMAGIAAIATVALVVSAPADRSSAAPSRGAGIAVVRVLSGGFPAAQPTSSLPPVRVATGGRHGGTGRSVGPAATPQTVWSPLVSRSAVLPRPTDVAAPAPVGLASVSPAPTGSTLTSPTATVPAAGSPGTTVTPSTEPSITAGPARRRCVIWLPCGWLGAHRPLDVRYLTYSGNQKYVKNAR